MKPISSIHAGEYLVGTHIEENYKTFNVWLPSKDTGIDLLVTDKTNNKTVSLQVKFSKDFLPGMAARAKSCAKLGIVMSFTGTAQRHISVRHVAR